MYVKVPFAIDFRIYVFNLTNREEVHRGSFYMTIILISHFITIQIYKNLLQLMVKIIDRHFGDFSTYYHEAVVFLDSFILGH